MMRQTALVLTKPAELGVLMRALAECFRAATVAFCASDDGVIGLVTAGLFSRGRTTPPRFRTIQVYPKDLPAGLR
jgi:hypothetical protein